MAASKKVKKLQASKAAAGLKLAAKQVPGKARRLPDEDDGCLIIRFNRVDVGGPWCLSNATAEELIRILASVRSLETMTPVEAFKGYPGKDYGRDSTPTKPAQDRLVELSLDDQDLSAMRLAGTERLFGFRQGRYFYVLWWDPNHEVFESKLKHT